MGLLRRSRFRDRGWHAIPGGFDAGSAAPDPAPELSARVQASAPAPAPAGTPHAGCSAEGPRNVSGVCWNAVLMDQSHAPAYRLVRRPLPAASAPRLDEAQQRVVEHEGGPLLVLAGPGTGKTTTIVAAVADRIE